MTQTQKTFSQKQKKVKRKIRFDLVNKFLLGLIIVSGVGFVVSVNDLSIKGFVLQDLKLQVQDLQVKNTEMDLTIVKLESYDNIEKRAQDLKMVKNGKIDYITVSSGAVAKK